MGMDCRVLVAGDGRVRGMGKIDSGGFSHEGEHDLALMVREFLESSGSGGAHSWCSSDSDSGCSDVSLLADKIKFFKYSMAQHEADLMSVVCSLMLCINEKDLHFVKSGACNASCIRFYLAKRLRLSGYDAAVCTARWQGSGKVPGGDHEYIDVIHCTEEGHDERLIIDIDFRSHFEIARAVDSYHRILNSLPVVYVGSLTRLNQYLKVMVEAAKFSLEQNSMPLPPWRSLPYLQSKWHSSYPRHISPLVELESSGMFLPSETHKQCVGHLKRLQSAIETELEGERLWKLIRKGDGSNTWRMKLARQRRL